MACSQSSFLPNLPGYYRFSGATENPSVVFIGESHSDTKRADDQGKLISFFQKNREGVVVLQEGLPRFWPLFLDAAKFRSAVLKQHEMADRALIAKYESDQIRGNPVLDEQTAEAFQRHSYKQLKKDFKGDFLYGWDQPQAFFELASIVQALHQIKQTLSVLELREKDISSILSKNMNQMVFQSSAKSDNPFLLSKEAGSDSVSLSEETLNLESLALELADIIKKKKNLSVLKNNFSAAFQDANKAREGGIDRIIAKLQELYSNHLVVVIAGNRHVENWHKWVRGNDYLFVTLDIAQWKKERDTKGESASYHEKIAHKKFSPERFLKTCNVPPSLAREVLSGAELPLTRLRRKTFPIELQDDLFPKLRISSNSCSRHVFLS